MKHRLLFFLALLAGVGTLISFSSGPTASLGDLTNSPLSNGSCANCHAGGNFNPTLTVEVLDGSTPITEYMPGQAYRLRVTIDAQNDPAGYGFQAVALQASDDENAGMFSNPDADTKVTPNGGRMYAEHNKRSSTNTFELDWTAPEAGTGSVNFFASGNAVNGANGSSGDSPVQLAAPLTLSEGEITSVPTLASVQQFIAFPNPVQNRLTLHLESTEARNLDVQVTDLTGRNLFNRVWPVQVGENTLRYDAANLPAGTYLVRLSDGSGVETRLFVKK